MEDTLYKFLATYKNLPLPVRNAVGMVYERIPAQFRHGRFYIEYMERLKHFMALSERETLHQAQFPLLARTVNHAIRNITFYRDYSPMRSLNDFFQLPVISKNDITPSPDDFIDASNLAEGIKSNTGGSSGTPMAFYIHRDRTRPKEKAHFDWYWGQFGFKVGARVMMVRGAPLANGALFEYQAIGNRLNVSCFEINTRNVDHVITEIRRFKPEFIHAYPSALHILTANIADPSRLALDRNIQAIFLGSEYLFPGDRKLFGKFYKASVINWYGHSECVLHGGNCPFSEEYHFYPSYGFLELLNDKGENVTTPGTEGRIVGTGFDNYVMPFIRYDTGDRGVLSPAMSCPCGFFGISLKTIEGRGKDHILLADGTRVSLTAFIYGQHFAEFEKIVEMQLQQDEPGKLLVRIVRGPRFGHADEDSLKRMMLESISGKLALSFEYVDHISKTHRGKHRFLIQNYCENN